MYQIVAGISMILQFHEFSFLSGFWNLAQLCVFVEATSKCLEQTYNLRHFFLIWIFFFNLEVFF
jgi:hypothetical protein